MRGRRSAGHHSTALSNYGTVGPYELRGEIGAGGMGVVHRALDPRLGREVAIKALPADLAGDTQRLARFEREARLLASVSHPNIGAIYGLEAHAGTLFLVLELVEGESLAARLSRGPLRPREALPIALQIASALEAAHEQGIVHRDLKPGNVMLRPDGQVKVLDFGLAKMAESGSATDDLSQSPTVAADLTRAGAILGTATYMSPEQVRGERVDRRADLWAFGCVLFECVTGRRAFPGDGVAEVLARVLEVDPDWTLLPADLPPGAARLLRRCLRKPVAQRLRDMGDARLEIEEAMAGGERSVPEASRDRPRWLRVAIGLGAIGLVLAVGWLTGGRRTKPSPVDGPVLRWTLPLAADQRLAVGGRSHPFAISADGHRMVYAAESGGEVRLHLRPFDAFESRPLSGTEGAVNPFFSPDGEWIGFFARDRLFKVSLEGGAPLPLCDVPLDSLGADWGPDGQIVYSAYASGLWRVPSEGGEPTLLTRPDSAQRVLQHRWPQILPGGSEVLFTLQTPEGPRLATMPLAGGEASLVPGVTGVARARYLPSGYLVLAQLEGLMAARFDAAEGRLLETPVKVLDWGYLAPDLRVAYFAVSDNGTLIYPAGATPTGGGLVWVDRSGEETPLLAESDVYEYPTLSPDGSRLVYQVGSEVSFRRLWSLDLSRGSRSLVLGDGNVGNATWFPSGAELLMSSSRSGVWNLYRLPLGGEMQALHPGQVEQWSGSVSPDGRLVAYYEVHPESARDIWLLSLEPGGAVRKPLIVTAANERAAKISPDGRWLAYVSDEIGRDEIFVTSFPEGSGKWLVSTTGGRGPLWSPAGGELFFVQGDRMMVATIAAGDDPAPGTPRLLFSGSYATDVAGNPNFSVSPDGQRFVMIKQPSDVQARELHVIVRWTREFPPHRSG